MNQIILKQPSNNAVCIKDLQNIMYIDENILISNIGQKTFLCLRIGDIWFKFELIEKFWYLDKFTMNFESRLVLNLERDYIKYSYSLIENNKIILCGVVKDKYFENYPYNSTMTKSMVDLVYYSNQHLTNAANIIF